ncbi:hypothetical protein AMTRI_Chr03g48450 [Amborella trichopoda]
MMMVSLHQLLPNNTSQISFSKRSCSLLSNKTSFVPSSFHLLKQHTTTCKSTPTPNPPISLALKPIPHPPTRQIDATPPSSTSVITQTPLSHSHACCLELYAQESSLKAQIEGQLIRKLRKLLMLAQHRRLLLSKLVHLGPDLGLPIDFRSKLCQKYPPILQSHRYQLWDYLFKFEEMNQVSPYSDAKGFMPFTKEAEKRACGEVREVLGLTMEKRTLVDHLTNFRKDFGLPNRLRAMLVRHLEMFYVSLEGLRNSLLLTEAYEGRELLDKDQLLGAKERLMELKLYGGGGEDDEADYDDTDDIDDDDDGFSFRDLWESGIGKYWEEVIEEEEENVYEIGEFWSVKKLEGGGSVDNSW